MVRIAIIDETFTEQRIVFKNYTGRQVSHGYLCENVLRNSSQCDDIIRVEVTREGASSNLVEDIPSAFLCAEEMGANLIVMSIGTTNKLLIKEMSDVIDRLTERGIVFVCACSNENTITFPAVFPNVIGVRYDILETLNEEEFYFIENPVDGVNVVYRTPITHFSYIASHLDRISNSVAAPHFAGWLYRIVNQDPSKEFCKETVIEILKQYSKPISLGFDYYSSVLEPQERDEGTIVVSEVFGEQDVSYKAFTDLSKLFENDGYCIGIIGRRISHKPHEYHFSVEEITGDGLIRQDIVEYLFLLAKIDALFVLVEGGNPLKDIESNAYICVGYNTTDIQCEMRLPDQPSLKELEHFKEEFISRFS